jgi:hypothetical protein
MFDFLKRLFGGKAAAPAPAAAEAEDESLDLGEQLLRLQRAYWRPAPAEKAALAAREASLSGAELLRLHHLTCLDLLAAAQAASPKEESGMHPPPGEDLDRCVRLVARLSGPEGPCRPRRAMVWQGREPAGPEDAQRPPDHRGMLTNASMGYLGALEIIRLEGMKAVRREMIPFDDIASIELGRRSLFTPTRVTLEEGRDGFVPACLPLLYGPSWASLHEYHRDGSMTTFAFHLPSTAGLASGMGLGHQDFTFADGGVLFGLGSIQRIVFPLDVDAPDFERRCRRRGIDPAEVRRSIRR